MIASLIQPRMRGSERRGHEAWTRQIPFHEMQHSAESRASHEGNYLRLYAGARRAQWCLGASSEATSAIELKGEAKYSLGFRLINMRGDPLVVHNPLLHHRALGKARHTLRSSHLQVDS